MADGPEAPPLDDFDQFFRAHYAEVVRTLEAITGERARADDAAQEAFAKALRRWDTVSRMDRPVGWVVIVGVNQLRRWLRREERDPGPSPAGHDLADALVDALDLQAAIGGLPPRQRAVVLLRFGHDLTVDQIATALGCASGTVKSTLHRALGRLRVELHDPDGGEISRLMTKSRGAHDA